ncbi:MULTISPECIES: radical SAM family heme chaperone HemW [unclassified Paraflavitalea]|uniref:radical SAM family heme chaperone HemW n=1 Tax=unclassified Paraflavitalea TaxID=2798305 RepID=UPI003D33CADD
MAGIYIHIPYCKKACHYCNFHFSTSLQSKNDFVPALLNEIALRDNYLGENPRIETIYFGGGTPSLLSDEELGQIITAIKERFEVAPDAELTLETNPDDITVERLKGWQAIGVNRLSIGVQSFQEKELEWMNRAHNVQQAIESIETGLKYFPNSSIDLIYGGPDLTDEQWKDHVDRVIAWKVPHVSCYALTVEPQTALDHFIKKKQSKPVDAEAQARQFLLLMQWLREAGYEHYEISNFALPGFRSRHNSSYWRGLSYLGLGPSAHSYDGKSRQWNVANNALYIQSLKNNTVPFEQEVLSEKDRYNEFVMISLRTMEGVSKARLEAEFERSIVDTFQKEVKRFIDSGWVVEDAVSFRLSDEGRLRADGVAAELFVG